MNYIAINPVGLGDEPPLDSTFATDFLQSLNNLKLAFLDLPNDIPNQFHLKGSTQPFQISWDLADSEQMRKGTLVSSK